ncbi:MAG TPA: TonB-dependent receptor [Hanamia sp.]|nr:TonB-dependent receptor [Hanamia sp.]
MSNYSYKKRCRVSIIKTIAATILVSIIFPISSSASVKPELIKPGFHYPVVRSIIISGRVTDESGQPLQGVTINERGTGNSSVTNADGNFQLSVASENSVIEISFVGFVSKQIKVGSQTEINIVLQRNISSLDSIVVVGYGTQKKSDLTGSISSIKSSDIASLPVPDVGQAIEGKASGVQVVSAGAPGSNVTIRVRGIGTVNNSDPLLVIDGVPTDIPLNTINPDDIASIDILKDASASAIYGSRGANGVVMITTKKGVNGQNHLSFNAFVGTQKATNMVKMLDASQFALLNNEMLKNNNQPTYPSYANSDTLGKGTDWLNEMFRSAPIQSYFLSYSGGNDKANYYVSGSYLNQEGIVINTGYKRYAIQFNSNAKVLNWLKFGNTLTLNHDEKPSGSYDIRNTMAANPTLPVYNPDGTYAGPVGQPQWVGDVTNPVALATLVQNNTKGYNILGSLFAEVTFAKGLTFKSSGGIQAQFWDNRTWSPKYNYEPIPQPSSYLSEQYNKSITLNWDNYFTYDVNFNNVHHLTAMLGTNAQQNKTNWISGNVQGFASDVTQQLNNGTLNPNVNGTGYEWALASYFGRINYEYANKYLFTGTIRRDGSSRFGQNNKWGTFPSASVAWRISNEKFLQNVSFINDLKIRAGYGVTGNQNIGNYSFASSLTSAIYVFNGNVVPAEIAMVMANPNVQWESVEQSNIGLDATLFQHRISFTIDAYLKNTSKMLVPMPVPISTGYSDIVVPYINTGKVQNKGIEIALSSKNFVGKFKWNTSLNISFNKNKVVSLYQNTPMYIGSGIGLNGTLATNTVGYPINAFYGYVMDGIFQNQKEVDQASVQVPGADPYNRTSPGDVRFRDLNNDGVINDGDRTILGSPNPQFIYAMTNDFSYSGFDLSIFLQGVQGNDIFNANNVFQESMAVAQNQTQSVLGRWEGEGTSNTMPRAIFNDPNNNSRISSRFLEDGSYLRIKNVTLGYTLPNTLLSRYKIQQIRIYVSAQNLLTFTKYSGFDPEVPYNGVDYNVYPVTRVLSLGLNITL